MGVACCMAHSLVLLLLLSTPLHAAKSCWTVLTVQDLQLQVSWHIYLCPVACGVGGHLQATTLGAGLFFL